MTERLHPDHAQRLHDLRSAQAGFKATLELLKSGYRFDDEGAPAALVQLEKALAFLHREIGKLEKEWAKTS